jgi:hypothetical protein
MVPMSTVVLSTDDAAARAAATIGPWPAAGGQLSRLTLSEEDICDWLGTAFPGDRIEYHRGHLAVDQAHGLSSLRDADCRRLSRVARRALIFAEEGRAHLVQRRHGDGDYSYLAIKARPPSRRSR